MLKTFKRRTKQSVSFFHSENISQIIRELQANEYPFMELARTVNGPVEGVLISKSQYDLLIVNATATAPDASLLIVTDDYIETDTFKVFNVLTGEIKISAEDFVAYAICVTVNNSEVQAMLLDKGYYDALIALQ